MNDIKIICTIGPASNTFSLLRRMILAGMNVARLNFSHGSLIEHGEIITLIRALNKKYSRSVGILGDLEGYRIRIGKLKNDIPLEKKQTLILSNEAVSGDKRIVPFDYTGDLRKIRSGSLIFIDDGNIELKVISSNKSCVKTEVVVPGVLKEQKGINIPGMNFTFSGLTDKDRANIEFCVKNKTDFIAQSFVRNKKDILVFRDSVKDRCPDCKIIAKIENKQGIKNIDEIIAVSDGIMIARGDMGVSMPIYEIAVMQKMIIKNVTA